MFPTVKSIKSWTGMESSSFNSKSFSVHMSYKKGLNVKQTEYVYSKCKMSSNW